MKHVRVSQMNLAVEMWLCNMWLCLLGFDVPYLYHIAISYRRLGWSLVPRVLPYSENSHNVIESKYSPEFSFCESICAPNLKASG